MKKILKNGILNILDICVNVILLTIVVTIVITLIALIASFITWENIFHMDFIQLRLSEIDNTDLRVGLLAFILVAIYGKVKWEWELASDYLKYYFQI